MRHGKKRLQLNRFTSWHKATLSSLVKNLLIHQSIRTTKQKAYAVRPLAEKLISLGKKGSLFAKRRAFTVLGDHRMVSYLFEEIAPRFADRTSGFTRIMLLDRRRGDDAQLAIIELTEIKRQETAREAAQAQQEPEAEAKGEKEQPQEERKAKITDVAVKEKPPSEKKPVKKFLGGLRNILKKERDSL